MSQIDPAATTLGDLVLAALKESGALGLGQTATAENTSDAWARCQWMLQEWERKRWVVFCLSTFSVISTGALAYSVGPGGAIDTGVASFRPDKIEYAFIRQLTNSQPNQIDYPLEILQSKEDYDRIALKSLSSFPSAIFYDPQWPLGQAYAWPVPQSAIYGLYLTVKAALPYKFAALNTVFNIPFEYYNAILYNLALRLRSLFSIPTYPGDMLPGLARDALNTIRGANTAIARLSTGDVNKSGNYNIFSDRFY